MPKQRGFIVPIIILGVLVTTIIAVGAMRLFSILFEKEAKSFISEFANIV